MKLETVNVGQRVEVKTHDFLRLEWTCPKCRAAHYGDVFNGKTLCSCGQVISKDPKTGSWKTPEGIPLSVVETPRIEKYSWRCLQCQHVNEKMNFPTADDHLFVTNPQGEFNRFSGLGKKRGEPETGLKCWYCSLVIQQGSDGEWFIADGVKE